MVQAKKTLGAIPLWITRIAPFILPAIFFQSGVFAFISPLPLFLTTLKNKLWIAILALAVNIALVYFTGFGSEAILVSFFWFGAGILFPFLIRKSGRVELSFLLSILYLVLMMFLGLYYLASEQKLGVIEYVGREIMIGMNHLIALPDSPVKALVDEQGKTELFKELISTHARFFIEEVLGKLPSTRITRLANPRFCCDVHLDGTRPLLHRA
jgi:hypothetical protein